MDTQEISNYKDLTSQIERIRESRDENDLDLHEKFKAFVDVISPVQVAKSALHEFVKDKEVQFDLVKGGLNLGADYIIDNVFNKKNNISGYLSSMVLRNVSSSFIQKNAPQIVIGMSKLISVISDQTDSSEENSEEEEDD